MSATHVVALVPVTGRAHVMSDALLDAALARLSAVVSRVHVISDDTDWAALVGDADVVLVHDPLCAYTPADVVRRVIAEVRASGLPVVPVLPCSDTVKRLDDGGVVIDTPDRADLRVVQSPVGYPTASIMSIMSGALVPGTVPAGARTVAGDPLGRRLASAVDVAMIDGGQA